MKQRNKDKDVNKNTKMETQREQKAGEHKSDVKNLNNPEHKTNIDSKAKQMNPKKDNLKAAGQGKHKNK
jgi:hypothetical protein